jgi:flagellar protein FliJ
VRLKPFQFRLQKVLNYRIRLEDQRKMELAELESRRTVLLQERNWLLAAQADALRRGLSATFDLVDIQLTRLYVERLDRDIARKCDEIAEMDRRVDEKREELIAASRDRRVMERLREKQEAAYMLEALRVEQKQLDEMGTAGFHRAHRAKPTRKGAEA